MSILTTNRSGVLSIQLPVEFTFQYQAEFRQIYEQNLHDNIDAIVLDFLKTRIMDSASLGMMLILKDYAEQHVKIKKQNFTLINCHEDIKQLLNIANFDCLFAVDF